jgi:UDP-glucose 4-epimerase
MGSQDTLNVLVTGGSGFIGTAVVAELVRRGHHVVATTRTRWSELPGARNLSWVTWDALQAPLPTVHWPRVQVILHLAAPARLFDFPAQAAPMYELAVAATFRLLEMARHTGVPRVVVASTGDVLGSNQQPACEDDVLYMPSSFYGAAKACSELLLRAYQPILSTAILRFYHPYGPGGERFLVNRLARAVAAGQEVRIEGEHGITLNPVWIEDLALGVCLAVESDQTGIFHLAGPDTLSLRELVEIVGTLANSKPVIRVVGREGIQRHAGGFDLTRQLLGYSPRVSVRDGLRRLLDSAPSFRGND